MICLLLNALMCGVRLVALGVAQALLCGYFTKSTIKNLLTIYTTKLIVLPVYCSRINIGEEFQAKIPEISQSPIDTHNAVLLWMPINNLDTPDNQQKSNLCSFHIHINAKRVSSFIHKLKKNLLHLPISVDNLLKMACSSVLPGGGTNTEYVLHCLFECRGDIMVSMVYFNISVSQMCSLETLEFPPFFRAPLRNFSCPGETHPALNQTIITQVWSLFTRRGI